MESCAYCGAAYFYPVCYHHTEEECRKNRGSPEPFFDGLALMMSWLRRHVFA